MGVDGKLAELAAMQHGLVTRAQAHELALSDTAVRKRCIHGSLRALHPGV